MAADANPPERSPEQREADERRFSDISAGLVAAVDGVVPGWIERLVRERVEAWTGDVPADVAGAARAAGAAARQDAVSRLRSLMETDVDDQRTTPLAVLRQATHHAAEVLADAGVPPVVRDEFAERSFPDDRYGLVPSTWEDVDPALHEVGMAWGAAKAYVFKARRRDEGRQ